MIRWSLPGRDIWRIGLVEAPISKVARHGFPSDAPVHWLPEEGRLKFVADPFGVWADGLLLLFAEALRRRVSAGPATSARAMVPMRSAAASK